MPEKLDKGEDEPRQEDPTEEKAKSTALRGPEKNYTIVDNRLLDYLMPLIGADAALLYIIYRRLYNKEKGYAWPSIERIRRATGWGRETIVKANRVLEKNGLVEKISGGGRGRSNRYIVNDPKVDDKVVSKLRKMTKKREPLADSLHLLNPHEQDDKCLNSSELGNKQFSIELETVQNPTSKQIYRNRSRKQQQVEPDLALLPDKRKIDRSEDIVVDGSSRKAEIAELQTKLCEIVAIGEAKAQEVITDLVKKCGADVVAKQLASLKAQSGIRNPMGWLIDACRRNYEVVEVAHLYKVEEPKSEEQIEDDARELRQGASVERESALRLATEYESDYLRRNIRQIKRNHQAGRIFGEFGAELVRRVETGYEPVDYPPRDR